MRVRTAIAGLFMWIGLVAVMPAHDVSALGLKVAPLQYKTTLKENEVQQGFIDVSNPSSQAVNVRGLVQTFRQINDDGGLQFYDDALISAGIRLDLENFELGPKEAIRVFFSIDGKTLPQGDVYAAIFFTTEPTQATAGVGQLVRVGSILSIVNKTPGERKAEVTKLSLPLLQLSDDAIGTYGIKNTGREGSGFYPTVKVSSWPSRTTKDIESSLVFGGKERSNDFSYDSGYGIHRIDVAYGDSRKSQWVITVAPWMLVLFALILLIVTIEILLLKKRRKTAKKPHVSNKPSTS